MAEKAAHLTGTSFAKPSIFEIAAHKSLAATLEPASNKIIKFLASVNPEKYSWFYQWSDEIFVILNTALQNYYLKHYSASFSETFYGLKRIILKDSKIKLNLDKKQINFSLIILVVLPYLQKKIDIWEYENSNLNRHKGLWKTYAVKIFKIISAVKEILTLYQYLLYLSNCSEYPTLSLRLLSISLTYANSNGEIGLLDILQKLKEGNITVNDGFEVLRLSIVRSIEISAFFLQFLQWWNQEHYYNFNLTKLPVPPPPQVPDHAKQYKGICPICRKPPWIHTVVSTSGFIYCYQCILPEIRKNKKCPVTGYPTIEDCLVRLYMQ